MGCDIHMRAEVLKDNKWQIVGKIFKNAYYRPNEESRVDADGYEWNPEFKAEPYGGRNYDLFAILADVRNGRGFAGIPTGEGFNPISEPKGIPSDASIEAMEFLNSYESDGHSHSYFTVKELLDYDWQQKTGHYGVVPFAQFKQLNGVAPDSYCGSVMGQNVVTIGEKDAKLYASNELPDALIGKDVYVGVTWGESYYESAKYFVDTTIPELQKLGDPENVRIVFFFDN